MGLDDSKYVITKTTQLKDTWYPLIFNNTNWKKIYDNVSTAPGSPTFQNFIKEKLLERGFLDVDFGSPSSVSWMLDGVDDVRIRAEGGADSLNYFLDWTGILRVKIPKTNCIIKFKDKNNNVVLLTPENEQYQIGNINNGTWQSQYQKDLDPNLLGEERWVNLSRIGAEFAVAQDEASEIKNKGIFYLLSEDERYYKTDAPNPSTNRHKKWFSIPLYEISFGKFLPSPYQVLGSNYYANVLDYNSSGVTLEPTIREVQWKSTTITDYLDHEYKIGIIPGYQTQGKNISGFINPTHPQTNNEQYFWNKELKMGGTTLSKATQQHMRSWYPILLYSNFHLEAREFQQISISKGGTNSELIIKADNTPIFSTPITMESSDLLFLIYRPSTTMTINGKFYGQANITRKSATGSGYGNRTLECNVRTSYHTYSLGYVKSEQILIYNISDIPLIAKVPLSNTSWMSSRNVTEKVKPSLNAWNMISTKTVSRSIIFYKDSSSNSVTKKLSSGSISAGPNCTLTTNTTIGSIDCQINLSIEDLVYINNFDQTITNLNSGYNPTLTKKSESVNLITEAQAPNTWTTLFQQDIFISMSNSALNWVGNPFYAIGGSYENTSAVHTYTSGLSGGGQYIVKYNPTVRTSLSATSIEQENGTCAIVLFKHGKLIPEFADLA